jgi:murein DD-endopeptidase MepM/ murein hydrolase activator NlpD
MNLIWPVPIDEVPDAILSGLAFGAPRTSGTSGAHEHQGIDLGTYGTQVLAAADGVVVRAYTYDAYGGPGIIDIDHEGGAWRTRYLHLDPASFLVKGGDVVTAGLPIATAALLTSAAASHLHFELLSGGVPVDPDSLLRAGGTVGSMVAGGMGLVALAVGFGVYYLLMKMGQ